MYAINTVLLVSQFTKTMYMQPPLLVPPPCRGRGARVPH